MVHYFASNEARDRFCAIQLQPRQRSTLPNLSFVQIHQAARCAGVNVSSPWMLASRFSSRFPKLARVLPHPPCAMRGRHSMRGAAGPPSRKTCATDDRFQRDKSDPSVIVFSELKRCQLPHFTQFFKKKFSASCLPRPPPPGQINSYDSVSYAVSHAGSSAAR